MNNNIACLREICCEAQAVFMEVTTMLVSIHKSLSNLEITNIMMGSSFTVSNVGAERTL